MREARDHISEHRERSLVKFANTLFKSVRHRERRDVMTTNSYLADTVVTPNEAFRILAACLVRSGTLKMERVAAQAASALVLHPLNCNRRFFQFSPNIYTILVENKLLSIRCALKIIVKLSRLIIFLCILF
jgi:hypothetical protein